ncbi:two pore domain potassium channel family protein [Lysobacter sp. HDW10]|uniref:two pore domain potassium channel family protein n=1 Tax=Lysobacter sp. HDW10 TaxID=2714936 RepID=UPI00140DEA04|nr:two pore domain potassium channel family protein [Lysobacter sp. HDW10]QIK80491.1 two pore domain potassium channel family protein [Lysobacter sp. HDW10]
MPKVKRPHVGPGSLIGWVRDEPSRLLLAAQFIAVLLYPFAGGNRVGHVLTSIISVGVLAIALLMVRKSPRSALFAALLSLAGVVLWIIHSSTSNASVGIIAGLFYAGAYFYAASALIGYMMEDEHATLDEIWAAAATFMLFVEGYAWIFMSMQLFDPKAFIGPAELQGVKGAELSWVALLFLSGTNFSATGMGDVLPQSPMARMVVIIEQWNGVMYLAVVLARLAGLIRRKNPGSHNG